MARIVALALLCTAALAHAGPSPADQLVADAEALAGRSEFVAAAAKYREAYAADPRAELMCNVGVAYYKALDLVRAYRYLDQCHEIAAQLDPKFVLNVEAVLAAVRDKLAAESYALVAIVVEPPTASTTIEGSPFDEPIVGNRRVWLAAGHYKATIHAEGYVDHVVPFDATAHATITVGGKLERAPAAGPVPDVHDVHDVHAIVTSEPEKPRATEGRRGRGAAITASVATGAVAALSVGAYLLARSNASQADADADAMNRPAYDSDRDSANRWQKVSWVGGALAGAGAIVSGYLWYRATRTDTHVVVDASPRSAGAALSISW